MHTLDFESEVHLSSCRKHVFAFLSLFLIILLIYFNTFNCSWHFDDEPNILENRRLHLKELSWSGVKTALFSSPSSMKLKFLRPVSRLSLALNYYFGGDDVVGYHIVNISIHMIASLFLYLFIYRTLNLPLLAARYGPQSYSVALLATTLWAASPVQTQAITYVVQRMASMAAMFYIMAMYFFLRGKIAEKGLEKTAFFVLCVMSGLLSFGAKENAILLPPSLLLYNVLILQGATRKNLAKTLKIFLVAYALPIGIVLSFLTLFTESVTNVLGLYEARVFTPWERLLTQSRVILFYMTLLIYPVASRLSVDHDLNISTSLLNPPATLVSVLLIFVILGVLVYISRKQPLIAFSGLFFFLNHMIESTILPLELVFEHRNYLPSMFFFVPLALGLLRALSYLSYKPAMKTLMILFIILVIVGSGHATFVRNLAWQDEKSLWLDCVAKYPDSFRGHHNLGRYYDRRNEDLKAVMEYHRALNGRELHARKEKGITYFNLGLIAHQRRQYDQAMAYYREALEKDSCCPGLHNNLAGLLLLEGGKNLNEAHDMLTRAVECGHDSEVPLALSNLGMLRLKMGKPDEAIEALEEASIADPGNGLTLLRLAYAHKIRQEWGKASSYAKLFLRQNRRDALGLLLLAEIYSLSGNAEKALGVLSQFAESIPETDFIPYIERLHREQDLMAFSPDMTLLLPLLARVYQEKARVIQNNRAYCLEKTKAYGPGR